jgi:hypothetical protein
VTAPEVPCCGRKPPEGTRAVVSALARHADESGYVGGVSRAQLLHESRLSRGRFRRALDWLQDHEHLDYSPGKGRRLSRYYLPEGLSPLRYPKRMKKSSRW